MAERTRVEKLEKLLREAELRAESERQRAEREQLRAEVADRQGLEEQQRAESAEEQTGRTTLDEYIAAYHSLIFSKFAVETDKSLTSKGYITNLRNKLYPTKQQRIASGILYNAFPTNIRLFKSRNFLSGLRDRISQQPIANEKNLEDPVKSILHQLKEVEQIQAVYRIRGSIIFENHPSTISNISEEPSNQLRPNHICIYRSKDGQSQKHSIIYVCKYKAPHKLTAQHLRASLQPMDVYKEVINCKTVPTSADPEGRFQYYAKRLTAAAISQTYHYIIEGGLVFGLLTTEEAITPYYHLAEPRPKVSAHPHNFHSCTAVRQYLAFTLIALAHHGRRQQHSQKARRQAEDFESTLRSIPANVQHPRSSSPYQPTTYATFDRSPYPFRHNRRKIDCEGQLSNQPTKRDSPEPSDNKSEGKLPDTPSPTERQAGSRGRGQARRSQRIQARQTRNAPSSRRTEHAVQYYTQKCLTGLVRGGYLNNGCPNVTLHGRGLASSFAGLSVRHPVSHSKWLQLLRKQLEVVLFRITLLAYGYTFVAKRTIRAFIKDLGHEAAVYKRLKPAQGVSIPVFLGTIDLRAINKIYYYDHRVYIVHLIFLSWGTLQTLRSIHLQGVVHNNVQGTNILFNPETNRIIIINFKKAKFMQPPRHPLNQLVPNKRAWSYKPRPGEPDARITPLIIQAEFLVSNLAVVVGDHNPNEVDRRGMGQIWEQAEEDIHAQTSLFSVA
ncbi:hypothetical protein M431DRAFT_526130 [Trichoderma harzianum CBS 226.95]|uniref:Protein kinase domain-containing protein n=1 Tax=Trichoderma harzianum CBS 226.95 TaxID=983964 RepID=A0A2T3ZRL2_TRIHA|nr:hypothetical protein M431DRAFT_526130 [Trichoderma harzianum CBS 226.95]PTB47421.1 hypothetical protein M431DRAFT_526130 [Trichoderma harzianum CBS 226.95]